MRLRSAFLLAVTLVVAACVPSARAQDQQAPAEPIEAAPAGPPEDRTAVKGKPGVDLRGTWLMVSHGELRTPGKFRNTVELWTGEGEGEAFTFKLVHRDLPAEMRTQIDEANRHLKAWTPTAEQLEELRRSLDRLPETDPWRYVRHTAEFYDPDHYGEAGLRGDGLALLEGSRSAIKVQHVYRPQPPGKGAQVISDDALYAVRATDTTLIQGDHSRVVLAAGFAPIPVTFQGPFWFYRLRAPGETGGGDGVGARLLEVWNALTRGCR
jgi:hypothetical protein